MKKIILLIIPLIIVGCNNYIPSNNNINNTNDNSVIINANQNVNLEEDVIDEEIDYTNYQFDQYKFIYPSDWEIIELFRIEEAQKTKPNDKVEFLDGNQERIALLTCPLIITGYEGVKALENKQRTINNKEIKLMIMQNLPEVGNEFYTALLLMRKGQFSSCQLFTRDFEDVDYLSEVYNKIYLSLE